MDVGTFGRYQLIEKMPDGDLGEAWRAHDTGTGQQVVVHILSEERSADDDYAEYVRHEARAAAEVRNPHLPVIVDITEINDRVCVATSFIDGRTLDRLLIDGVLPPEHAVSIVEQVASALSAAHHAGLVHGHVTTANIVLTQNNFALLTGLGIAPDISVDEADDVRGLGRVLADCLTTADHSFSPPPALGNVVAKATADDQKVRYSSVKHLARDARAAVPAPDYVDDFATSVRIPPMARPAAVTTASVFAFLQPVFLSFLFAVHVSIVALVEDYWIEVDGPAEMMTTRTATAALGVATAVVAGVLIWGGIAALRGRRATPLRYGEQLAALVAAVGYGPLVPLYMTVVVISAGAVIVLLGLPSSRQYFGTPALHSTNQFDVDLTELEKKLDGQSMVAVVTVAVLLALGWTLFLLG